MKHTEVAEQEPLVNISMNCGCIYETGSSSPWYACARHIRSKVKPSGGAKLPVFWLYTLKLRDGKYYVGITSRHDPHVRIKQHGGPFGAKWTQIHKPVEVLELKKLGDISKIDAEREEQIQTLSLISTYGYQNVRGGQLVYSGKYTKFLGRYFTEYNWDNLVSAMLSIGTLLAIIVYLAIRSYN